jgi:hypothetical protein
MLTYGLNMINIPLMLSGSAEAWSHMMIVKLMIVKFDLFDWKYLILLESNYSDFAICG